MESLNEMDKRSSASSLSFFSRTRQSIASTARSFSTKNRSSLTRPRGTSVGTTVIFPQNKLDQDKSNAVSKKMEKSFGFHFFTNAFLLEEDIEKEYQCYCNQTNLKSACNASLSTWCVWILLSLPDLVNLANGDKETQRLSIIKCLLTFPVILPIPLLVHLCQKITSPQYVQLIMTCICHFFAFSLIAGGYHSVVHEYGKHIEDDINQIFNAAGFNQLHEDVISLNQNVTWWSYKNVKGNHLDIFRFYLREVLLASAQLNINIARPIVVLVCAPLFKLDVAHFIFTCITINLGYYIMVATMYPDSSSASLITNKFLLIFALTGLSIVLVIRMRQSDRVMRLNFLHVRGIEEKVRDAQKQKEMIQRENISLKMLLEKQNKTRDSELLNMDSPMTNILNDIKNIQKSDSLSSDLRDRLDEVMQQLSKHGQNLYAPDIQKQLKRQSVLLLDIDTKSWATSVLSSTPYQRNDLDDRDSSIIMSVQPSELHPNVQPIHVDIVKQVKNTLGRHGWNVDMHQIDQITNGKSLYYTTFVALESLELLTSLSIDVNIMSNFLWAIDNGYLKNPYHNRVHAADVVASVSYLIADLDDGYIRSLLTTLEVFAALIAAAIHDFRHPGKSNNYLIKSGSLLAIQYSDSSILERMHLAESFLLLKDPINNIFNSMNLKDYAEVRKAVIEMVISTDLTNHLSFVGSLKATLASQSKQEVTESPMTIMKIVLKTADIGHSAKPTSIHAHWSELLIEEFFLQGDAERALNMELSPFMNRESENSARNQVGFFEFIVIPFYHVTSELIYPPGFFHIFLQLKHNYELWKEAENKQYTSLKDIYSEVFASHLTEV